VSTNEVQPIFGRLRKIHTALVADILDQLGYRDQVMGYQIRPAFPEAIVIGTAFPIVTRPADVAGEGDYEALFDAYEHMGPGDVIVIGTAGNCRSGLWGELLSCGAIARGVTGIVIDGLTRDVLQMNAIPFPSFVREYSPTDSHGRIQFRRARVPVECGGVVVRPGDVVFGDYMGVVVSPRDVVFEVVELAESKDRGETTVRQEILAGASVREVFTKYGIL
jgi:4-hydroxy-4-methyl-2-oxoglutarate aldolase